MLELAGLLFDELNKIMPERYRVRLLSCLAAIGLTVWIGFSARHFVSHQELEEARTQIDGKISSATTPLAQALATNTSQVAHLIEQEEEHQALNDQKSIFDLKAKECKLKGDGTDIYRDNILRLADEYNRIMHDKSQGQAIIPACGDL